MQHFAALFDPELFEYKTLDTFHSIEQIANAKRFRAYGCGMSRKGNIMGQYKDAP
jgi:hypothetical protein